MKTSCFAFLGGKPAFNKPLPVGQLYFPSWERYEMAFRDIFERQYYTNQGVLTQRLEKKLQQFLQVRHAICVTNATIGLTMVADALELSGKVILPSFTFAASAQSLIWAGLEPLFCDINPKTHQIDIEQAEALINKEVSAIMGVNLWGGACDPKTLANLAASKKIQVFFDSAHAFGCEVGDIKVGNFGLAEVFSFHATKILSGTEGGCICTNDDNLASRLRNIRSSYGAGKHVHVVKTANGRMSEAQAAIALMSLEDFPKNQKNNAALFHQYEKHLNTIPGIHLLKPTGVDFSNYQYVVCTVDKQEFGLSRDLLLDILKAENVIARRYFYPGIHRTIPFAKEPPQYLDSLSNTDNACSSCIQFPIGALVFSESVERICDLLMKIHQSSSQIRLRHEK